MYRWIESLNTVMDDNKVLTLASNERIALTKEMRLLFEVGHLQSATPATVSRGNILPNHTLDFQFFLNSHEVFVEYLQLVFYM